jgi:hypothetical protein
MAGLFYRLRAFLPALPVAPIVPIPPEIPKVRVLRRPIYRSE